MAEFDIKDIVLKQTLRETATPAEHVAHAFIYCFPDKDSAEEELERPEWMRLVHRLGETLVHENELICVLKDQINKMYSVIYGDSELLKKYIEVNGVSPSGNYVLDKHGNVKLLK